MPITQSDADYEEKNCCSSSYVLIIAFASEISTNKKSFIWIADILFLLHMHRTYVMKVYADFPASASTISCPARSLVVTTIECETCSS